MTWEDDGTAGDDDDRGGERFLGDEQLVGEFHRSLHGTGHDGRP